MRAKEEIPLGLYLHVPFCSSTCDFCAFYQEKPSKKGREGYFQALEAELSSLSDPRLIRTVFVGGGTPGLLNVKEMKRLGGLVRKAGLASEYEWTVEIAPAEISFAKLESLAEIGVNRISLGVQTFDDSLMDALGRNHSPDKACRAYDMIREIGFDSVNLDLIFGIPGQSLAQWEDDLKKAVSLNPDHLSTYCLTFEEDTALFVKLSKGQVSRDPEREASFYERAWEFLPAQGFGQYEISNYSLPAKQCLHNLNTWRMHDWIGCGPSACSQFQGLRRRNFSNLEQWSSTWLEDRPMEYEECEALTSLDLARDAILFGLRMNEGICLAEIARSFGLETMEFEPVSVFLNRLEREGLGHWQTDWFSLTPKGRILADAIALEIPELAVSMAG
ncbi:MAG: radical SAM family heme chaperone HemW [Opitutales bacterium]